ncbi:GntR family transcriptional regulator [Leucobacter iarius]|uniref:HTH gntR-type domain-containing protein n=1 Tax=Leucobacter iarius TaxID=333963 RepID=A0ABN2L7J6_9MICO
MAIQATTQPLRRVLLKDEAHARLSDAIIGGELAPGTALPNAEMEEWLGVSRSTLREAFSRLELAGLVVSQPNRYTRVSEVDTDAYRSTAKVLHMLLADIRPESLEGIDLRIAPSEACAEHLARVVEEIAEAERNPVLAGIVGMQILPLLRRDAATFARARADVEYRGVAGRLAEHLDRGESAAAAAGIPQLVELGTGQRRCAGAEASVVASARSRRAL